MRATIWIHKDNEEAWKKVGKGIWVNDQLRMTASISTMESSSKVEQDTVNVKVEGSTPSSPAIEEVSGYCIHGLESGECTRCLT